MHIKIFLWAAIFLVGLIGLKVATALAATSKEDAEAFEKCRKEQVEKGFPDEWARGYCSKTIPGSEVVPTKKGGDGEPSNDRVPTQGE